MTAIFLWKINGKRIDKNGSSAPKIMINESRDIYIKLLLKKIVFNIYFSKQGYLIHAETNLFEPGKTL